MQTIENLYIKNKNIIYRFVYSLVSNKEDAEDLTASTFLTAIKRIEQTQGFENQTSWLFSIAHNHIRNFWKKKKIPTLIEDSNPLTEDEVNIWETIDDKNEEQILETHIREELETKI